MRETLVREYKTGYELVGSSKTDGLGTVFFWSRYANQRIPVTGRDIHQYRFRQSLTLTPGQLIEVGAGLGGIVAAHIETYAKHAEHTKPIVIDPVQYGLLADMLYTGQKAARSAEQYDRMHVLLKRAELMLDSAQVELYNCSVQEALKKYSLRRIGDIVIDHCGATLYGGLETPLNQVDHAIRVLVKPNGQLYRN